MRRTVSLGRVTYGVFVGAGVRVGGAGVRVGWGVGVARGVGVGEGVGLGDGVNEGSGRGVNVSPDALADGLGEAGAPAPPGTNERAAPATTSPTTARTSSVATTLPHRNDVRRRSGAVASARAAGTIGSGGSLPRVFIASMVARRYFVGRWPDGGGRFT